jgi:hypothetical protein
MIYFPDTNYFLHFKDPSDAPWSDLTKDDLVRLIVCRTVQREIDKKKHELKGRQQKRARRFQTVFRQIILEEKPAELRASSPRVTLALFLDRPSGWEPPPELDVGGWGDDALVTDLLAFKEAHPFEAFALLTGDTGILATAKHYGIPTVPLDGEDWELPDETDDRDKKIAKLEQEVRQLRQLGPKIESVVSSGTDNRREVRIEVVRYSTLSGEQVDALSQELEDQFPIVTGFEHPHLDEPDDWVGPTKEDIAAYRDRYSGWLHDARDFVWGLRDRVQKNWFIGRFQFVLKNVGVEPAMRFVISFETTDGILLRDLDKSEDEVEEGFDAEKELPELNPFRLAPNAPEWKKLRKVPLRSSGNQSLAAITEITRQFNSMNKLAGVGVSDSTTRALMSLGVPGYRSHYDGLSGMVRKLAGVDGLVGRHPEITIAPPVDYRSALVAELIADRYPKPHDPNAFLWKRKPKDPMSKCWEFECEEFRHQGEHKIWNVGVVVKLGELPKNGGVVRIAAHAKNLRDPFRMEVPVRVIIKEVDTLDIARSLLPSGA